MQIIDLVNSQLVAITPEMPLFQVQELFETSVLDSLPVVNQSREVLGLLRKKVLQSTLAQVNKGNLDITQLMDRDIIILSSHLLFEEIHHLIHQHKLSFEARFGHQNHYELQQIFPVVNEYRQLVGILPLALYEQLEKDKEMIMMMQSALDTMLECVIVVNKQGKIVLMNRAYGDFLGVNAHDVIGQPVTDLIENSRLHLVAQTGKPEVSEIQRIKNHNCIVSRVPMMKNGRIIGAMGKVVFKDVKELNQLIYKHTKIHSELSTGRNESRKEQSGKYTLENIIGGNEVMKNLKSMALKAAKGSSTVLILGESGTGKEVFAQAIFFASSRRQGPFIKVNCAAVPENLLESELFGYDEGAFTGARKGGKPGKFELAHGGTIFLDEIGDMSMTMQSKLLRVLQEREFERVGSTKTSKVDVRVIAATNRDLEKMVAEGNFRLDLFYRLNIITLQIPPLRERKEDIPLLVEMLLEKIKQHVPHGVEGISAQALRILFDYSWPGNIRELENILERAINLIDDERYIMPEHLPAKLNRTTIPEPQAESAKKLAGLLGDTEKQAIYRALELSGGNKSKAAKLLGIHRSGFYQKLQKYNIQ